MSNEYKTITNRVKTVLNGQRTAKLSEDLSSDVVAVNVGQYVPGSRDAKPCVYIRPVQMGLSSWMAGGQSRMERLMFVVSAAASGNTQQAAIDDLQCLMNNIEQVLANYANDSGYWSAGTFGRSRTIDTEDPEWFGEISIEPGQDACIAHCTLVWSCDVRIGTDTL